MATMTYTGTLVVQECCNCGIWFAIPHGLNERALRDHSVSFWCPLGHRQHYIGKTEAEKLRERVAATERTAEHYRSRAETAIRSRNALKGQVTKVKNRVAKGVCPCCKRSFPELAAHMESKHPEFVAETVTNA